MNIHIFVQLSKRVGYPFPSIDNSVLGFPSYCPYVALTRSTWQSFRIQPCNPSTPDVGLLPKHSPHPFKYTILLRIVWVVFTRNLQHSRKRVRKGIDTCPDSFGNLALSHRVSIIKSQHLDSSVMGKGATHMLVDQDDSNILPLLGEAVECPLDRWRFGLGVDHQEVPLTVCTVRHVLYQKNHG